MILKAKERGDAAQLARYLLAMRDNDHVELHDVRGFVSDDLAGAFSEADAIAQGHALQELPVLDEPEPAGRREGQRRGLREVPRSRSKRKLGLDDQPRAIVFHEKDGRRHAHVVWSRIDSGSHARDQPAPLQDQAAGRVA